MKENWWSIEYATEVIDEYKKFLFLASMSNVSPSPPIDRVWHTHLLFTKDYKKMCDTVFKKFIHHVPTDKRETKIYDYVSTLELYKKNFKQEAPRHIWTRWYEQNNLIVDLKKYWVIPIGDIKSIIKVLIDEIKHLL
jgi:hypothetical protein